MATISGIVGRDVAMGAQLPNQPRRRRATPGWYKGYIKSLHPKLGLATLETPTGQFSIMVPLPILSEAGIDLSTAKNRTALRFCVGDYGGVTSVLQMETASAPHSATLENAI
jgi:hypothetical protein